MASPNGYDANLLNSAPQVDKRALQEGYSTDLLNEKPASPALPTPQRGNTNDSVGRSRDPSVLEAQAAPPPRKQPFYRTTKGMLTIGAVLVVIIVAAIVGGVVGSKNKGNSETPIPLEPNQPPGQDKGSDTEGDDQQAGGDSPALPGVGGDATNIVSIFDTALAPVTGVLEPTPTPGLPPGDPGNQGSVVPDPGAGGGSDPFPPTAPDDSGILVGFSD